MKIHGWLAALAVGVGIACGGSSGPKTADLAGTWDATRAELVEAANPSNKIEMVAMGATLRLVLDAAKSFSLTVSYPGLAPEEGTGTWSSSVDTLTLTFATGPTYGTMQFQMSLSGDTLSLDGADTEFDFDGDDVDEPAKMNVRLTRQR